MREEAEQHLDMIRSSLGKVLKNEIQLAQLKSVSLELHVLTQCFRVQRNLLAHSFLDSLLELKELAADLSSWFSHVPFKESVSKPHFFSFAFAKAPRAGPKLALLSWISLFFNTLLAKTVLYFHDLLVAQVPAAELKAMLSVQPSFVQTISAFTRRANPVLTALILDRMDSPEPFYGQLIRMVVKIIKFTPNFDFLFLNFRFRLPERAEHVRRGAAEADHRPTGRLPGPVPLPRRPRPVQQAPPLTHHHGAGRGRTAGRRGQAQLLL